MLETIEMVRFTNLPIVVMKEELTDIPFSASDAALWLIAFERAAGAKALRDLVEEGQRRLRKAGRC